MFSSVLRGHPDQERQQDGQKNGGHRDGTDPDEETRPQQGRRLGNTPAEQQLPHCLTELMERHGDGGGQSVRVGLGSVVEGEGEGGGGGEVGVGVSRRRRVFKKTK